MNKLLGRVEKRGERMSTSAGPVGHEYSLAARFRGLKFQKFTSVRLKQ